MNIERTAVYGLEEAVAACRIPKVKSFNTDELYNKLPRATELAERLAKNPADSGHPNFLKGITVYAYVNSTIKWWQQVQRYNHFVIVSSMSTMHKICDMIKDDTCWGDRVLPETITLCHNLLDQYEHDLISFDTLVDNVPLGLNIGACITTNYMQLRIIYNQRKNHKYAEWGTFCDWIEHLPYGGVFITGLNDYTRHEEI